MSQTLCACLSVREQNYVAIDSETTRVIFTNFSVHVAYGRGSALFRHGDEIPRGRGFSSPLTMHCNAFAAKRDRPGRG